MLGNISNVQSIIDQKIWDIAHEVCQHKKRSQKDMETPNSYSGLVFCADCGKPLVLHRAHTMAERKNNFKCSTYKKFGKEECTSHYLKQSQLEKVILDDLKRVTHFARQEGPCLHRSLMKRILPKHEKKLLDCKKKLM